MNSADDALQALVNRRFRYLRAPGYENDKFGVDFTLLYVFAWREPFIDAVHVRAEGDATAVRARSDGENPALFGLKNLVWAAEGSFIETVAELLALPEPGTRGAPDLLRRAPSRLWARSDGPVLNNSKSVFVWDADKI